ncbi:MAG TPA: hypothetical protein VGS80_18020, partial [Ktedonobacterales bacterium]|nr:hypothetical protein [Ktedonobacterales bacterium]
ITDPALFPLPQPSLLPPRPRPSFTLAPQVPRPPTAYDAVRSRLQLLPPLLQSHPQALLFAAVGLFLAVVLVITALLAPPLLALLSDTSTTTQPIVAGTARPVPTFTAQPSPSPSSTVAIFVALDTRTQGNWQGVYGSAGYVLAGDTQQLPDAIQVTPSGAALYTWACSTDDARAPVKPANPADRIAACWYAPTSFALDIAITDGHSYQFALYLLDWDQRQRVEMVRVVDLSSGTALDTRPARTFATGTYFVWKVRGHVSIQITNAAGSPNAVVSALFFAPA